MFLSFIVLRQHSLKKLRGGGWKGVSEFMGFWGGPQLNLLNQLAPYCQLIVHFNSRNKQNRRS